MRYLKFKVTAQIIEPVGDFSNLVPGTSNYLFSQFEFSEEWDSCVKVACFYDRKGEEYACEIRGNKCIIPKEVLVDRYFKLKVIGARGPYQITTNKLKVTQGGV